MANIKVTVADQKTAMELLKEEIHRQQTTSTLPIPVSQNQIKLIDIKRLPKQSSVSTIDYQNDDLKKELLTLKDNYRVLAKVRKDEQAAYAEQLRMVTD